MTHTDNSKSKIASSIDHNIEKLMLKKNASIREALQAIEIGKERLCFVVDNNLKLLKVVSDGDIRRALLKGYDLSDPVRSIHERKPVTAKADNIEYALKELSTRINVIPVIGDNSEIIGIIKPADLYYSSNIRQKPIAIIGLGYVGLTLALILSENGFLVFGHDNNLEIIEKLEKKKPTFFEKGIQNLLNKHVDNNFIPVQDMTDIEAEIFIITVGTPIFKDTQKPNINHIRSALKTVGEKLKKNGLIILRSTLPVGFTRDTIIPEIEKISGLKVGSEFSIAFCPERTSEGQALQELRTLPQIIGAYDQRSRELSSMLFRENTHTIVDVGSLEGAEFCKLMDNTFRDTMFSYSNQMATLSEAVGLNIYELISKVNLGYKRNAIPFPSPGVGGPCLSKDPYILIDTFSKYGLDSPLIKAARKINEHAPDEIFTKCENLFLKLNKDIRKLKIFIMGLAFKGMPETSDLRDSTSLSIANHFKRNGVEKIYAFDPVASESELEQHKLTPCSINDGFKNSSLILILNNHNSYKNLDLTSLIPTMKSPGIFYDGWNLFSANDLNLFPGIYYLSTGNKIPKI